VRVMRLSIGLFLLLILGGLPTYAQEDSIRYHTDLYFLTSSQSFQPHWQVSNRYGIFDRNEQTEAVGLFGLSYQKQFWRKFKLETEVEFNLKSDISTSYFQQLYLNLYYGSFQLKMGKEAYTIGQYSDELGSGSLFVSNNSRPVPRLGIGFYHYTPVPFIENYLSFKGMMNFGVLDDDRTEFGGTDKPYYHEKFLYLKTNFLPINMHAGLNHSALFGGTRPNGTEIPVDFWATFFGKGSNRVGGGEATNAAGAHFGLYDFGLDWRIKETSFQVYYQMPFADDGGMQISKNRDQLFGMLIKLNKKALVSNINYEYLNTMWQGSWGVPDAVFDGKIVDLLKVEDPDAFMLEHFDTVTVGFTNHQLKQYSEDKLNYGYKYNGRDDIYNNGLYRRGKSYHEQAIGSSLIISKYDMKEINPEFEGRYDMFFVSNRIISHHLAFDGFFSSDLSYRIKLTYTRNYGSHAGPNKGRYRWASREEPEFYDAYYFKDGLNQAYTFLELNYTPFKDKGARFTSSIAYDFGEIYHNFGMLFGFHYDGFFRIGKTKKD
jgi:hypothetical protein